MISIIITVYNKEEYIYKTLVSASKALREDDEIVIVNDGSIDNSSLIIDKYIKENTDININFINRNKNLGVCHSKKEALLNAKNDFVIFLDGDDLINYELFRKIERKKLKKEKLNIYGIKEFSDEKQITIRYTDEKNKTITKYDYEKIILSNDSQNSLCNKIYYKNYLIECFKNIENKDDYAEDLYINLKYIKYVNKFIMSDNIIVFYRKGISSLTTKWAINQYDRIAINPYNYRKEYIYQNNLNLKYEPLNKLIEMTYTCIKHKLYTEKERDLIIKKLIDILKDYKKIRMFLKLKLKNKYRFIYIFIRIKRR